MARYLDPEALYVIEDRDVVHWVRTPDGIGCYWYDEDNEDAKTDVCDFQRVIGMTIEEFEAKRGEIESLR